MKKYVKIVKILTPIAFAVVLFSGWVWIAGIMAVATALAVVIELTQK